MEFISGIIIGVVLTFIGELISHRHLKNFYKEEMSGQLRDLLQAIHDEVEAMWNQYHFAVGSQLEELPDGKPFAMNWKISQDYFTVFNTNANSIGKIKNSQLRSAIIKTYIKAKGLIDSLQLNSDMNQALEKAIYFNLENVSRSHQNMVNGHQEALKQYAPKLKQAHTELKSLVKSLLPSLLEERNKIK